MKDDAPSGEALVLVERPAPLEPVAIARSLEEVPPGGFVYVDDSGQVRSPGRYRALQAVSYGATFLATGLSVTLLSELGPAGLAAGVGVAAAVMTPIILSWQLRRAQVLTSRDRLDEAELLLRRVRASRLCPRPVRAHCEQELGRVAQLRTHYSEALAHQRAAMTLYGPSRRHRMWRRRVEYAEVVTLVNLDRTAEARQRFEQLGAAEPAGDYLRLHHWVAELYVCLAEGEHRLDGDVLHERAHVALGITSAAALLGLLAWAYVASGDEDTGHHLLREALDRRADTYLDRSMPRLHAWMEANAAAAATSGAGEEKP